jgi:hypothetical protein
MISKIIIIGWTCFIGYTFVGGMFAALDVGASDAVFAFGMLFSAFFHLALWLLVALPTYMISRMFQRRRNDAAPAEIRRRRPVVTAS